MIRRRWAKLSLSAGGWTLLGLFFSSQTYLTLSHTKFPITWAQAFVWGMLSACLIAIPTPLVFWLSRRFPFGRRSWWRSLLIHLPASVVFSIVLSLLSIVTDRLLGWLLGKQFAFIQLREVSPQDYALFQFEGNILIYMVIAGIGHAYDYYRKYQERELKTSQLEVQLAQAQLQALKMQLHPHFLFNTLNAIWVLMAKDVEAARQMLVRLSDLLRLTLENSGMQEVSLKQELDFLDRYLGIEQIRFRDRLKVKLDIEPDTLDAQVPNLILQPLVENAIRHGIAPRAAPGQIEIHARRENGMLYMQVRDDGPGLDNQTAFREGVGLTNTKARLLRMYGSSYRFDLRNAAEGGLMVTVAVPFHIESESHGIAEGVKQRHG